MGLCCSTVGTVGTRDADANAQNAEANVDALAILLDKLKKCNEQAIVPLSLSTSRSSSHASSVVAHSGSSLRNPNLQEWHVEGNARNALGIYLNLLCTAQSHISIATWIVYESPVMEMIASTLLDRLKIGVRVTIAHFGGVVPKMTGLLSDIINITGRSYSLQRLIDAGARVITYGTEQSKYRAIHEKLTSIDRKIVVFSDRNLSSDYYDHTAVFTGLDLLLHDVQLASLVDAHICSELCDNVNIDSDAITAGDDGVYKQTLVDKTAASGETKTLYPNLSNDPDYTTPTLFGSVPGAPRVVSTVASTRLAAATTTSALVSACNPWQSQGRMPLERLSDDGSYIQFCIKNPVPGSQRDDITPQYIDLLRQSSNILIVNAMFDPDERITDALIYAALHNNARIVVITNYVDHINNKCTANLTRTLAHRAMKRILHRINIATLAAATTNIQPAMQEEAQSENKDQTTSTTTRGTSSLSSSQLHLYGYDFGQTTLHNKFLCTERGMLFGSYNFDFFSNEWSEEYVIRLANRAIIGSVLDYTRTVLLPHCRPIQSGECCDCCLGEAVRCCPCCY